MDKAVLISIRPKWCELIANGKKTIEVRKTMPKIQTPFKVYIYQTRKPVSVSFSGNGKHISEYDKTLWYNSWSGKVIGEFICNKIEKYTADDDFCYGIYDIDDDTVYKTRLENGALWDYGKGKPLYGWHISELVIYDKPKELSEFMTLGALSFEELQEDVCNYCRPTQRGEIKMSHGPNGVYMCEGRFCDDAYKTYLEEEFSLKRPPQSWCYVEE